jgi:hypothetical protein
MDREDAQARWADGGAEHVNATEGDAQEEAGAAQAVEHDEHAGEASLDEGCEAGEKVDLDEAGAGEAGDATPGEGEDGGVAAEQGEVSGDDDAPDASGGQQFSAGDQGAEARLHGTGTPQFYTEFRHTLGGHGGTDAEWLSIDVGDAELSGEHETGLLEAAASPEAAERERLMTALEEEAQEEEREARETEAQILAFADSASPVGTASLAPALAESASLDGVGTELVAQYAYSTEDEKAAQEVLAQLHSLLGGDPEATTASDGEGGARNGGRGGAAGAHAAAEELFRTQPACVRRAMEASLSRDDTGEQVVEWLRGHAATVLQLAYRCHRSRHLLATFQARRWGNTVIDFDRMARRLIEDLEAEDGTEYLADSVSHAVSVLSQLPEELALQVRRVVRESPAPLAATFRLLAATTIRLRGQALALRVLCLAMRLQARVCVDTQRLRRQKLRGFPRLRGFQGAAACSHARTLSYTHMHMHMHRHTHTQTHTRVCAH